RVLGIRRFHDFELAVLHREPSPARAELRLGSLDEFVAELIVAAKIAVDLSLHRGRKLCPAAIPLHPLPKLGMVVVLAGIVEQRGVLAEAFLDDLFEALALQARARKQLG